MITRIVKLTFRPDKIEEFTTIYQGVRPHILAMSGCYSLSLQKNIKFPNVLFTISTWETEAHLNEYRKSPLFAETWLKTKLLFCAMPEAWSVENVL